MALLPVGSGDLALPRLAQRPAGERLELAAHQRPPEEGAAREAGGRGVQAVAKLQRIVDNSWPQLATVGHSWPHLGGPVPADGALAAHAAGAWPRPALLLHPARLVPSLQI